MKKILTTGIIFLFASGVYAQLGAPKELTCTEEAFNFSVSLGSKWKLTAPRMGPVGVIKDEPDYTPALALKVNNASPKTEPSPLFEMPFGYGVSRNTGNQQKNVSLLAYYNAFNASNKHSYFMPAGNFNLSKNNLTFTSNLQLGANPLLTK